MRPIDADELLRKYEWLNWYSVSEKGHLMKGATTEDNPLIHYYDGEELIKNAPTLNVAPTVDAGPKWISVEDELPKLYTDVLVYRRTICSMGGYMSIEHMMLGYGDDILWMNDITSWKSKVTHWMPLPEPPKES